MDKVIFKNIVKQIRTEIAIGKNMIDKAIDEELSMGNKINFEIVLKVLDSYSNDEEVRSVGKKIAVCYTGNLQVTLSYILDSILNNNVVTLCISDHKIINTLLVEIVDEALKTCKIKNEWYNFDSNNNELYIKDTVRAYNEFVYVGDYYEYERFKKFINKPVKYNNFGSIKLFIDQKKFNAEYNKILNFATKENIYVEVYDDPDDFIAESKDTDFSVIYGDTEILNKVRKLLRGEMMFNSFPFDDYKFDINKV